MPPRIIAIANQKGGVGKTTTTVNLAYAFLKEGKRVLAIDLDPQASLSISLGLGPKQIKEIEAARRNIYFALVKGRPLSEMIVEEAGRGRPDLVPASICLAAAEADLPRIVEIDVAKIVPNPDQPRRTFDEEKLRELADSIAENGLIHPVTVRRTDGDSYMIVAGERRFRAFAILERQTIPAIISEGESDELALIENIQREDLAPLEEFEAVARLVEKHGYSQGDAARVLGKSRVSVNELLSLGSIAPPILEEARTIRVPKSVLIEIARAADETAQRALWNAVRAGGTPALPDP